MDALVQAVVDNVLSALMIGVFFSMLSLGVVLALAASYISHFWSHDRPIFKVLVVFLVLLSIADASSLASWGFSWAVMAWSDPESVTLLPVEATLWALFSGVAIASSQCFFTYRVYAVSGRKNYALVGVLSVLIIAAAAVQLRLAVFDLQTELTLDLAKAKPFVLTWCALTVGVDIIITAAMYYYIVHKARRQDSVGLVESPLKRIITRCIQTNAIATLLQVIVMILLGVYPSKMYYAIFAWQEVHIYSASLIATLNARTSSSSFDSHSLSHSTGPTILTNPNRKSLSTSHAQTRSRFGTQSLAVRVEVEHEVAVEVDPEAQMGGGGIVGGGDSRYAVRFDEEKSEYTFPSEEKRRGADEHELARFA